MATSMDMPKSYSNTEIVLHYMLDSQAGRSFLDSGMAYGYNNDRNKAASAYYHNDKRNMPSAYIGACYGDIEASSSLFHALNNSGMTYDPKMTRKFYEFASVYDEGWLTCLKHWYNQIGAIVELGENTHDDEHVSIDQIIQFDCIDIDGDKYVVIQSHNGCDIRGGYSAPYIFKINHYEDFVMSLETCGAYCSCESVSIQGIYVYQNDGITEGWPKSWAEFSKAHKDTSKVYCVNCADRVRAESCGL